jgi:hypothetical protein
MASRNPVKPANSQRRSPGAIKESVGCAAVGMLQDKGPPTRAGQSRGWQAGSGKAGHPRPGGSEATRRSGAPALTARRAERPPLATPVLTSGDRERRPATAKRALGAIRRFGEPDGLDVHVVDEAKGKRGKPGPDGLGQRSLSGACFTACCGRSRRARGPWRSALKKTPAAKSQMTWPAH